MENEVSVSPQHDIQSAMGSRSSKRRAMKIASAIVAAGIVIGAIFYVRSVLVVAIVDGAPITRLSVVRQLERQEGRGVLDALIAEILIGHEAAKKGITISDDEVSQGVKNLEASIGAQGGTLQAALTQKGLTEDDLRSHIKIQKMLEKLLADKLRVTEQEIGKFIADNKVLLPKGQEAQMRSRVADQIRIQKLNQEAGQLVAALKAQAKITQYVNY